MHILSQPDNTDCIGNLQVFVRGEYLDDCIFHVRPNVITCSARTLRLTLSHDFITMHAPDYIFNLHRTTMYKCCKLWCAAGCDRQSVIINKILGDNLIRPNVDRFISLFEALQQMLTIRESYPDLHHALHFTHSPMTNDNFRYIEEHLDCAMPIADIVEVLGENNNYFGNVLPRLTGLIETLGELEVSDDLIYEKYLAAGFRSCIIRRFQSIVRGYGLLSEQAVIAVISCPLYKDTWMDLYCKAYKRKILYKLMLLISGKIIKGQTPINRTIFAQAKYILKNFLNDSRENMSMLSDYPEIAKIFFKYFCERCPN